MNTKLIKNLLNSGIVICGLTAAASASFAVCGDGLIDGTEACDLGRTGTAGFTGVGRNDGNPLDCNGDGTVGVNETDAATNCNTGATSGAAIIADDDFTNNLSGCTADCRVKPMSGWTCSNTQAGYDQMTTSVAPTTDYGNNLTTFVDTAGMRELFEFLAFANSMNLPDMADDKTAMQSTGSGYASPGIINGTTTVTSINLNTASTPGFASTCLAGGPTASPDCLAYAKALHRFERMNFSSPVNTAAGVMPAYTQCASGTLFAAGSASQGAVTVNCGP